MSERVAPPPPDAEVEPDGGPGDEHVTLWQRLAISSTLRILLILGGMIVVFSVLQFRAVRDRRERCATSRPTRRSCW